MRYLNILDCSIADGDGIRVVLFVSGCNHNCLGCHNPESWKCNNGKIFTEETKQKLFKLLDRDYADGITFSGGDPLFPGNRDEITKLSKEIREKFPSKTQWLYTGYLYDQVKNLEIMKYLDVVVDGPFILTQRDIKLPFRGSTNQNIIKLRNK